MAYDADAQEDEMHVEGTTAAGGEPTIRMGKVQKANEKRITTPYLTKYERARILGTRALQIR